jgi:uncharacterized membrane protein YjjP (DUF1212 family)
MPTKSSTNIATIIIALVLVAYSHAYADTDDVIIGKVVAVVDGRTITLSARYWQHSEIANIKGNSYRLKAK